MPYTSDHANGFSFASKLEGKKPESLLQFEKVVGPLPNNLDNWIKQGILLLNSSLTVGPNSNINYFDEWKPFLLETINALNKKDDLVWVLMGAFAQKFQSKIKSTHQIICIEHPAAASWENREWISKDFHIQVNNYLKDTRNSLIKWESSNV